MSDERRDPQRSLRSAFQFLRAPMTQDAAYCIPDSEGHCITCSDEALPAKVLRVDQETGLALVTVNDMTEEVDITLVEDVTPGDMLLVHGGIAIASLNEASDE
jgi:hydrogenase assembly chaperone HypC/HupF